MGQHGTGDGMNGLGVERGACMTTLQSVDMNQHALEQVGRWEGHPILHEATEIASPTYARKAMHPTLGELYVTYATDKSYICYKDTAAGKNNC